MKMSFRWYGPDDPVKIEYISQIPNMKSIVTAVYDTPVGEVWSEESINALKKTTLEHGLEFSVIESVPVHEDIKLGKPSRDRLIANYCENVRRLGKAGVKVICYNFMPVFDWTRTTLAKKRKDGSTCLAYDKKDLLKMDPINGEFSLPGWDESYEKDELKKLFAEYENVSEDKRFDNLKYFLDAVIPAAKESGIKMAIHPDDPPYPIFGLPRIITCEENIDRFLKLYDETENGLTFCTGSLGCSARNNIYPMIEKYSANGRIHFMHVRNVLLYPDDSFEETGHFSADGSLDIVRIMKILKDNKFDGYTRPDHGRMIFGEKGRPGYGLYDRALGAAYLNGIWEAL